MLKRNPEQEKGSYKKYKLLVFGYLLSVIFVLREYSKQLRHYLPKVEHLEGCNIRVGEHTSLKPIKQRHDGKHNECWSIEESNGAEYRDGKSKFEVMRGYQFLLFHNIHFVSCCFCLLVCFINHGLKVHCFRGSFHAMRDHV